MILRCGPVLLALAVGCAGTAPALDYKPFRGLSGPERVPATWVIFGDTRQIVPGEQLLGRRASTPEQRKAIMDKIVQLRPAFVVHSGDLVYNPSLGDAWKTFDAEHARLREEGIPYYAAFGNHEYWGNRAEGFKEIFGRFPHLEGRRWYLLGYGPLRLLVVDSNFRSLTEAERTEQLHWLEEELAAADRNPSVRVVGLVAHHPVYTNFGRLPPIEATRGVDASARRCSKYKLFFSGHVHSYERFLVDGVQYVVSGGGGAPLSDAPADPARWRTPPAYRGPARRRHNIVEAMLSGSALEFRVHELQEDLSWNVMDTFRIGF